MPVHVAQGIVNSGKLVALAVGSNKRHPVAASMPTFAELGVKGVDVDLWYAFFEPTKTPAPVVQKLNADIAAILQTPEVRELLGKAGMDAAHSSPAELQALVAKDYPRWRAVIKRNGITAE